MSTQEQGTGCGEARVTLRGVRPTRSDDSPPSLPHGVVPWCDLDVRRGGMGVFKDDENAARYKGLFVVLQSGQGRLWCIARRAWSRGVLRAWRSGKWRFTEDYTAKLRELRRSTLLGPLIGAAAGGVVGLRAAGSVASDWTEWALFGAGGVLAAAGFFYALWFSVRRAVNDPARCIRATFDSSGITATLGDGVEYRRTWADLDPVQPSNGIRFNDGLRIRLMPYGRGLLVVSEMLERHTEPSDAGPGTRALFARIGLYILLGGVVAWLVGTWMVSRGFAPPGFQQRLAIMFGVAPLLTAVFVFALMQVMHFGCAFWRRPYWRRAWRQWLIPESRERPHRSRMHRSL